MGKNVRRITKQKWYDEEKVIKRKVNNGRIEYYVAGEDARIDPDNLIKNHLEKNTNKERTEPWRLSLNTSNFVYKNLKKHELNCLAENKKFCGFASKNPKKGENREVEILEVLCDKKNVPREIKKQLKNGKIKCCVEAISEEEVQKERTKNDFLEKLNQQLFVLVNSYINQCGCWNSSEISQCITGFGQEVRTYINEHQIADLYEKEEFLNVLDAKLKKSVKNGKAKVNNNYLHMYYYEMIFSSDLQGLEKKYELEFYKTIKWFKNSKYELNKEYCTRDGEHKIERNETLKKRLYRNEDQFDISKMYQKEETVDRMERLLTLRDSDQFDKVISEVVNVFALEQLKEEIKNKTNVFDELSVKKIIDLQKNHYKNEVVRKVEKNQLFSNNEQEKRQLMRMFNVYLKGRYSKTCSEFKCGNLTKDYLLDIYNPSKIETKFKSSLINKLNLFYLSKQRLENIKSSTDLEYNKMLQTYNMKLIEKLDYCSKLPIENDYRISDLFYKDEFKKKIKFDSQNKENYKVFKGDLVYEVDYFPKIELNEKNKGKKFKASLEELRVFRNKVLHNKLGLDTLMLSFSQAKEDVDYLNDNIESLIDNKLQSNNVYKFFESEELNDVYLNIIPNSELDIFKYNINIPKFSKVFNNLYYSDKNFTWLDEIKRNISDDEKLGALKYFLQTVYYYGFSNTDIIIEKKTITDHVIEMQRNASIKGNSKKENKEFVELVAKEFKQYILDMKVSSIKMLEEEIISTKPAFENISFKEAKYTEKNILFNLAYYLDTKRLSSLIHDTKKLIQALESIDRISSDEKEVLQSNIEMMNLLMQYKDRLKNINYEQIVGECEESLKDHVVVGSYLQNIIGIEEGNRFGKRHKDIKKIKQAFEKKIELYNSDLSKLKKGAKNNYKNLKGQTQELYKSGEYLIIHSGIEYYQKYNASKMLEKLVKYDKQLQLTDGDINNYEELLKIVEKIETEENNFINEFNKEIKNTQGKRLKEKIALEFKEKPEYKAIVENNAKKNKYHYLNNKIKFNHMNYLNSFIDDVLARMNSLMLYWERDANLLIDNYVALNPDEVIEDKEGFYKEYSVGRKSYLKEKDRKQVDCLLEKRVNYKVFTDSKEINALDIRNYLSHNNYYGSNKEEEYSLLELMNIIHNIMGYNLKYQKSVLEIFNKILLKYRVGNESNSKHMLPLRYNDGKIDINNECFIPRNHNHFQELKLNSNEYVDHLEKVLKFKYN